MEGIYIFVVELIHPSKDPVETSQRTKLIWQKKAELPKTAVNFRN